ncbi:hypothetical protein HZH66_000199 [Vespula vulgaris]|uniref:Uncharacterized protein n=1 Tax=Vespula vulgaris TaxID=7454 RepID=A0A834NKY4_VESVU|nr:hypothetical protein HZH66_000199 [Vespula vulgaris]
MPGPRPEGLPYALMSTTVSILHEISSSVHGFSVLLWSPLPRLYFVGGNGLDLVETEAQGVPPFHPPSALLLRLYTITSPP